MWRERSDIHAVSYFAPYIDSNGMHIPTYQDIVNQMVADAQNIFGSDIYLGIDTQDYQWISAVSQKIYDSFLTSQAVYNSRGPATAIGSGLDVIVGINGIKRNPAVYSTCPVVITGTAGLQITGGIVSDVNGVDWSLPSPTIIGTNGTVTVTATCQTSGAITANPGDINSIVTPTLGWTSVSNTVAATVGTPVETDSALRARQAISTAQASKSIIEGMEGALADLSGVTRFKVYENDTSSTDANGLPAHSVTCVVEGGASADIGQTIFDYKGPGCGTNGTTTVPVTDSYGVVTNINYDVLGYVDVDVVVNVKKLSGYTTDTTTAIQTAISSYENTVAIGTDVYISSLWGAALSANPNSANPAFSVTGVQAAVHLGATLSSALVSGTAYTSLSVSALNVTVASGASLTIGSGSTTQVVTASAAAAVGATSIPVASFTANAAYAIGTVVAFTPGTVDIPVAFNQASRGNTNYITVNAS